MEKEFSKSEISEIACSLIKESKSKILCFYGEMGTGKTTLIKSAVLNLLGIETANSPSYGLINIYKNHEESTSIYHCDLYRLNSLSEAIDIGVEELLYSDDWVFIEWPNLIKDLLKMPHCRIYLSHTNDTKRKLTLFNMPSTS